MGEFDPPFEGATHYPTMEELHTLNVEQLTYWLDFLRQKIFEYYFPYQEGNSDCVNYVIITWDKVEIINDTFVISGKADHRYLWPQFNRTEPFDVPED